MLILGHPKELIDQAVTIPDGHFVRLNDMLFEQHGLGHRIARVQTQNFRQQRRLSYAYLDLHGTTFDLITELDGPVDLGSFEDLATDRNLVDRLADVFVRQTDYFPTPQRLALALIRCKDEGVNVSDELGLYRVVKWAGIYEGRAHWITKNRQQAYSKTSINWKDLRL